MKKKTILLDMDNTLTNSAETIIKLFYKKVGRYIPIKQNEIMWDFKPYIIGEDAYKWALSMFSNQEFYDNLELYPNCYKTLKKLSEKYELVICTKKEPSAVAMCDKWLREKLPFIDRIVYLSQHDFDKSCIMADYRIDDKWECLNNEYDDVKILFGNFGYQKEHEDESYVCVKLADWDIIGAFFEMEAYC